MYKAIGDLGFLNYNHIYLLGINKTYNPLYNIYKFPTMLVRLSRRVISTEGVEPTLARKKKIRGGHKVYLRKLISSVNHLLRDIDSADNNAELLSRNCSEREKSYYQEIAVREKSSDKFEAGWKNSKGDRGWGVNNP